MWLCMCVFVRVCVCMRWRCLSGVHPSLLPHFQLQPRATSLTHTPFFTLSFNLSHTPLLFSCLYLSLSFSYTHTHTQTHTHIHTHTHTQTHKHSQKAECTHIYMHIYTHTPNSGEVAQLSTHSTRKIRRASRK